MPTGAVQSVGGTCCASLGSFGGDFGFDEGAAAAPPVVNTAEAASPIASGVHHPLLRFVENIAWSLRWWCGRQQAKPV
ncbi:hypothetical protein Jiend_55240 [Micromonospora endophytica]|nr:hypothetical protein Jiend_55240 [Micromonospora endophytica]